jgi:hypothetical protein
MWEDCSYQQSNRAFFHAMAEVKSSSLAFKQFAFASANNRYLQKGGLNNNIHRTITGKLNWTHLSIINF